MVLHGNQLNFMGKYGYLVGDGVVELHLVCLTKGELRDVDEGVLRSSICGGRSIPTAFPMLARLAGPSGRLLQSEPTISSTNWS